MKLSEVVKEYLLRRETDYGILIDGDWGSGKTFYVNNDIRKEVESLKTVLGGKEVNYRLIYVSLFGISSSEDLHRKIFIEINPILKKKAVKVAGSILDIALSKLAQIHGTSSLSYSESNQLVNIFGGIRPNTVLVFDDLERLDSSALNEVFGLINEYSEHQKLKVIIVADESKIGEKVREYARVKEKLIRFTFRFSPKLEEVFCQFIDRYDQQEFKSLMYEYKEFILNLFKAGNHLNLRTLRFALDLLEGVHTSICASLNASDSCSKEALEKFYYFLITFTIEYKKGVKKEFLDTIISQTADNEVDFAFKQALQEIFSSTLKSPQEANSGSEYVELFQRTYLVRNKYFQSYPFLFDYILHGYLNRDSLMTAYAEEVQQIQQKREKDYNLALQTLKNYYCLEDDQLKVQVEEVLKFVADGKYDLETYQSILILLFFFLDEGLINYSVEELLSAFEIGIRASLSHSKFAPFLEDRLLTNGEDTRIVAITNLLIELNSSIKADSNSSIADNIFEAYRSGRFEDFKSGLLAEAVISKPIFRHFDAKIFYEIYEDFANMEKYNLHDCLSSLLLRYEQFGSDLATERSFFEELKRILEQSIGRGVPSVSRLNEQRLLKWVIVCLQWLPVSTD